jgi:competence ComEA-like helix-hairpin-helix protein
MDCLFSGQEVLRMKASKSDEATASCVYQLMHDDYCLGTAFLPKSQTLPEILEFMGLADQLASTEEWRTVPCDKIVRFKGRSPFYSLEKIAGAHLIFCGRPVDINLADEIDLLAVPGIGPRTAEKIVRYRESVGGFVELEDLRRIPGIGRKKLATMAPFMEVKPSRSFDQLQYVQAP